MGARSDCKEWAHRQLAAVSGHSQQRAPTTAVEHTAMPQASGWGVMGVRAIRVPVAAATSVGVGVVGVGRRWRPGVGMMGAGGGRGRVTDGPRGVCTQPPPKQQQQQQQQNACTVRTMPRTTATPRCSSCRRTTAVVPHRPRARRCRRPRPRRRGDCRACRGGLRPAAPSLETPPGRTRPSASAGQPGMEGHEAVHANRRVRGDTAPTTVRGMAKCTAPTSV